MTTFGDKSAFHSEEDNEGTPQGSNETVTIKDGIRVWRDIPLDLVLADPRPEHQEVIRQRWAQVLLGRPDCNCSLCEQERSQLRGRSAVGILCLDDNNAASRFKESINLHRSLRRNGLRPNQEYYVQC